MIRRLEIALGVCAVAVLAIVHGTLFRHAGALWRDEINSVNLATLPSGTFWSSLQFDSFPVAWSGLLRAWTALGGGSDAAFRALGLIVGMGVLVALWWNARRMGAAAPLASLALLGFCAAAISYGDSVRAYGLGMLTGLLAFDRVRAFSLVPDLPRGIAAAAAATLAVHCVFYNAILVMAACAGGAAVALLRRRPWTIVRLVAVGAPAALSLALYAGMLRRQKEWVEIVRWPIDLAWIGSRFHEATSSTGAWAPWAWLLAAIGSLGVAAALVTRPRAGLDETVRQNVAFCGAALGVGAIAYLSFLLTLSYIMQPWYFLTALALGATCFDGILFAPPAGTRLRAARLAAAAVLMAASLPGAWRMAHERRTSLDLVAEKVAGLATAGDLIVVTPWQYGITFARYYHGTARWTTVPPMAAHDLHRYDLLRDAMRNPDAMRPVLDLLAATLRDRQRIFWIGELAAPPPGEAPPILPPAPEGPWRWQELPHYVAWRLQAGHMLRERGVRLARLPVSADGPVSPYERLEVSVMDLPPGAPDRP